jgi:hypothetical protein
VPNGRHEDHEDALSRDFERELDEAAKKRNCGTCACGSEVTDKIRLWAERRAARRTRMSMAELYRWLRENMDYPFKAKEALRSHLVNCETELWEEFKR